MRQRMATVVLECFLDLGITIVYATLAGLLIVAIVASDQGLPSVWSALAWTSLLPGAAIALIGVDAIVRAMVERPMVERPMVERPMGHSHENACGDPRG